MLVLEAALLSRLILASLVQHPGHGDHAFYYTVAENLVDGRGLQIDYIWNYLSAPETITHSSNDYWMPLTSMIIGVSLFVFGKSLFAALLPSILSGLVLFVLVYFFSKIYSNSRFVAFCSASLILFVPSLFIYSLSTDSTIYYALFVSSSLFFMIRGWTHPNFFLLSAGCAGLAHLTRQDGILLVPTLLVVILLSPHRREKKSIYLLLMLALYLLVLSPLIIDNYKTFGLPFPPGPSKTMFLTEYEDLYSYSKELSLGTYLDWGIPNILWSKIETGVSNAWTLYEFFGDFLAVFAILGMLGVVMSPERRRRWSIYWPPMLFLGFLFISYTLIITFPSPGGFKRSAMSMIPFLVIISIDAVERHIPSRAVAFLVILLVASFLFSKSVLSARNMIASNAQMGQQLAQLKEVLQNQNESEHTQDIVIMTRNPWEVYYLTRYKAIQIPNGDLSTILEVAQKYGANYLLLPAPREALEGLYQGTQRDQRFEFVTIISDSNLKLFRIK